MTHPTRQFFTSKIKSHEKVNTANHRHDHFMFGVMHSGQLVQFLNTIKHT